MKYGSHDFKYSITYLVYHNYSLSLILSSKRKMTVMSTIVRCMYVVRVHLHVESMYTCIGAAMVVIV